MSERIRRSLTILVAALALHTATPHPALGQPATIAGRVAALGLETIATDRVLVSYSEGADEEALFFADEVAAAVDWYRQELDWDGTIRMAVLDAADYPLVTPLPYPSPHAETATGFIVVADRADDHPGFDLWDLDNQVVSAAWAFHEVGHVIARDLGIVSANLWVNELIANVIMAGYIRAARPELIGYQSGMPPRFASQNRFGTLAQFDEIYFQMGQSDYLWFHFHLAALADFIVDGPGGLVAAIEGLRREFPLAEGRGRESIAATVDRLERVRGGVTAIVAPLIAD
jgi:hypothetical protein